MGIYPTEGDRSMNIVNSTNLRSLLNVLLMLTCNFVQASDVTMFHQVELHSSAPLNGAITDFALDSQGNVYVLEDQNRLKKFNSTGVLQYDYALQSPHLPARTHLNDLLVDSAGNIILRVSGYYSSGDYYPSRLLRVLDGGSIVELSGTFNSNYSISIPDHTGNLLFVRKTLTGFEVEKQSLQESISIFELDESSLPESLRNYSVEAVDIDLFDSLYLLLQRRVGGVYSQKIVKIDPSGNLVELDILNANGYGEVLPKIRNISVNRFGEVFLLDATFSVALDIPGEDNWRAFKLRPPGLLTQIIDVSGDGTGAVDTETSGDFGHIDYVFNISGNAMVHPIASATDRLGVVYIAGITSNNVFRVNRGGEVSVVLDESGDGLGFDFKTPRQIEVDRDGNVFVLATGGIADRIFKISHSVTSPHTEDFDSGLIESREHSIPVDAMINYGDNSANDIGGGSTAQYIFALGGDDVLRAGVGFNYLFGGDGQDIASYPHDLNDYAVSQDPLTGDTELIGKNGDSLGLALGDIETLQFRDQSIANEGLGYWGSTNLVSSSIDEPIFRFFNVENKAFFYTANVQEAEHILEMSSELRENVDEWSYVLQGATFATANSYPDAVDLHRFYNYQTGHHFFTVNEDEVNYIHKQIEEAAWPFIYEQTAFKVYPWDPNEDEDGNEIAVHRFFSPSLNRHVFTASPLEALLFQESGIWNYEGVGFYGEKVQ